MYREVAIDPACMADYEYYILLKREFGFEKGRYASADVKRWAQIAHKFAKESDIQPIKRASVKSFLNRVRGGREGQKFILNPHRRKIQQTSTWNEWWLAQTELRPFAVSLSKTEEGCISHEAILNDCEHWEIAPSMSVLRNAKDIVSAVEPLIQLSDDLLLVDQYFLFSGNDTLQELAKVLRKSSVKKLTIVSSEPVENDPQDAFVEQYAGFNGKKLRLKWIYAPKFFFHDRYLISDIGAVSLGHGYSTSTPLNLHSDRVEMSLKSVSETERLKQNLEILVNDGRANVIFDIAST